MKKIFFAIIACCFAVNTVFSQKPFDINLTEDKPYDEIPIMDNNHEHGRIFIRINGETNQGKTPVSIQLQNTSYDYDFLLCDHAWGKKELRKQFIHIDKRYTGESTKPVEHIGLKVSGVLNNISGNSDEKYTFSNVYVEEGKKLEVKIPVHLIKPKPGLFCKKRKMLYDALPFTLHITVDTKDPIYDKLHMECDSLLTAFNAALARNEFCTNPKHTPSLDEQVEVFFYGQQELEKRVGKYYNNCSPNSKKSNRYEVLYDSVHEMKHRMENRLEQYRTEKHECEQHQPTGRVVGSCKYCELSLEEISKRMGNLYWDLYNKKKEKAVVIKEARALYYCCISHKREVRQWTRSEYKKTIMDYYNKIKEYKP